MDLVRKDTYKENFSDYLLCLALDVGEGLLRNGAEVGRVEDTIERICYAYGAEHVEVFSIISFINAAVRMPDGSYSSQLRRVKNTANNLGKLENYNALSREVCRDKPALDVFDQKLKEIKKTKTYPKSAIILAYAIGAISFSCFFGGNLRDAAVSFVLGLIIGLVSTCSPPQLTEIAKTAISAFLTFLLAEVSMMWGIGSNEGAIITGVVMLLVPGVLFGTAMRDIFCGDLLAGSLKILQALLIALMIAFGYVAAALVF